MVEDSPPQKNDEQHPLLKVESGGGDSGRSLPSAVTPGWNVTCSPKRSWMDRWPELISTFWLSGMLLGIFFLILYGLGLGVIRRQPILMLHCNTSRPGSELFYHHIVQRGNPVPFRQFSEYLATMASLYSSLRFNVFFLMDDTLQTSYRGSRRSRFFNKLIPLHPSMGDYKLDENNQQELKDFHLKYQNVNVTIMPLSKYMAMTPLRYKWRTIPIAYLTFYARVFSVWQTGGIGIDLDTFSAQFNRRQLPDKRISAILKQHNNGIKPDEYTSTLNNIDREEQNEFISLFYGIVYQILNETRAFFNRTLQYSQDSMERDIPLSEPLIRTHRNKRDLNGNAPQNNSNYNEKNVSTEKNKIVNTTDVTVVDTPYMNIEAVTTANSTTNTHNKVIVSNPFGYQNKSQRMLNKTGPFEFLHKNISEPPQIVLFYDISLLSNNNKGPSYLFPEALVQSNLPALSPVEQATSVNHSKGSSYILSINVEGTFIAASLKQHPFLAHIISAGCQRMPPRFAVQDAIISQCSNLFRDDFYCSNIYLL